MRRFEFRLDSVLRIREHEFEKARQKWLELERERRQRADRVAQLVERLALGRALLDADVKRGVDAGLLAIRAQGIAAGRSELEAARAQLEEIRVPCQRARELMFSSRVRVRSLERLRESEAERHRAESLRMEQAEIDELSLISRSAHRRAQAGE